MYMKSFICLAVSCVLVGLLYVYVRQQVTSQNAQISKLSDIVKTLAQEITRPKDVERAPFSMIEEHVADDLSSHREVVSDDEEDDSENESDEEEEEGSDDEGECSLDVPFLHDQPVVVKKLYNVVDVQDMSEIVSTVVDLGAMDLVSDVVEVAPVEIAPVEIAPVEVAPSSEVVEVAEIVLNSDEPNLAKTVQITKENYADWPLKRLKEKIAEMKGPSTLKTKKAILEFLEQNVS